MENIFPNNIVFVHMDLISYLLLTIEARLAKKNVYHAIHKYILPHIAYVYYLLILNVNKDQMTILMKN